MFEGPKNLKKRGRAKEPELHFHGAVAKPVDLGSAAHHGRAFGTGNKFAREPEGSRSRPTDFRYFSDVAANQRPRSAVSDSCSVHWWLRCDGFVSCGHWPLWRYGLPG